jgi:hypothetical protein
MVLDIDDVHRMMSYLDAGRAPEEQEPYGEMVTCSAKRSGTPPTCKEVAATYVSAVGARTKPFLVTVQQAGKTGCVQLFDASGEGTENLDESSTPLPPIPEE